jgi:hypothetical protein
MLIGIIGNGFVGRATRLLGNPDVNIYVYDILPELCIPNGLKFDSLTECDMIFICLPTPMNVDGTSHTNQITNIINKLKQLNYYNIIVRSTVPINYCKENEVFYMPEFLTENNWKDDFINNQLWVFGLVTDNKLNIIFKDKVTNLINLSHKHDKIKSNNIIFMLSNEAELLKLIKNTFLACKVGYFNEIYDLTKKMDIDYDTVIKILSMDTRIGPSHTKVPGYNNTRGFGGTCFPKDMHNMYNIFNKNEIKSYYIKSALERNEYYDRPQRDWLQNLNRTVINVDKNVILILGSENNCNELCNKLIVDSNNIIICPFNFESSSSFDNFLCTPIKKGKPMFFSKLNYIYYSLVKTSVPDKKTIIEIYNILKLSKVHKCKTFFEVPKEDVFGSIIMEYSKKGGLDLDVKFV